MNENFKKRIDDFKKTIGFDYTYFIDNKKVVLYQNLDISKLKSAVFRNSVPVKDRVFIRDNGILKEMEFATEDNPLSIELFIASSDYKTVTDRLINKAVFTTTLNVLYTKCPYNLGDISCSFISNDSYHIMWTYYNVFFSVEYSGKKINVEQFCRELQKYTENFVVTDIDRYRPRFDELIVSSSTIKLGEEITLYIVPDYGEAFKDKKKNGYTSSLKLEKTWKGSVLSLEKETDFFFRFKGIAEGTETITFILADLDALTCSRRDVTIKVTK